MSEDVVASEDSQSSFEAALAAAIGSTEQAPAVASTAADPAAVAAVNPPSVPAPVTTSANSGQAVQPDAPTQAQLDRAAALEARESKIRESETKLKTLEAREAALVQREQLAAKQWDAFERDPVAHIQAMRPELSSSEAARVAEKLYFHAMGDKAPPEFRQRQEVARVETKTSSEVSQLRAELEEMRASQARTVQEARVVTYKAELRSGAETASDAPIVANLAKRNPERASEMLFEVARRAAVESRERGDAEPVVLTPAQAAAKLEAILKAERDDLFGPAAESKAVHVPQSSTPSSTISNRDASIQPNRTVPDPFDDKVLRKAALEAAGLGHIEVWD